MLSTMTCIDQILKLADAYAAATGVEGTTLSWRVFGDTKKLGAIRSGGDLQTKRFEGALGWFADNWPTGEAWPDGVAHPAAPEVAA